MPAVGWRLELPPARASTLAELQLAIWLDDPAYPVESEIATVLGSAVAALEGAGARLVERTPPVTLPEVVGLHQELLYPLMQPSSTLTTVTGFRPMSAASYCAPGCRITSATSMRY